jgi:LytS/YehU family sensor histidine kinase
MSLNFQVNGEVSAEFISPMILMTFIENCFKHGIHTNKPGAIDMIIDVQKDRIVLDTKNEIHASRPSLDAIEGIGVENAKRRLEHDYPQKHQLHMKEEAPYFYLHLEIEFT